MSLQYILSNCFIERWRTLASGQVTVVSIHRFITHTTHVPIPFAPERFLTEHMRSELSSGISPSNYCTAFLTAVYLLLSTCSSTCSRFFVRVATLPGPFLISPFPVADSFARVFYGRALRANDTMWERTPLLPTSPRDSCC